MNKFQKLQRGNQLTRLIKRHLSNSACSKWKSVVGLEVHAQIISESKLFSRAPTKFSAPVNANVSLYDYSMPGTLPILNKKCVESGVLTALALNCTVNPVSMFDRKHYFYADMPAGYQITQQRLPLAVNGKLDFQVFTPGIHKSSYKAGVRIKQLQLEEDSGRSLHYGDRTLIDLNRAGVPLMEVVFEPDLTDGEEAAALVKELVAILQRINTCSCKMEEGALRVDANVSIHRDGEPLGNRTEIKNIGSVRGVANAIRYEIARQIEIKNAEGTVKNETRAWDAITKTTVTMRDKDEQHDYRYMPEPNLPPLRIAMGPVAQGCVNADQLKLTLPELPEQTRLRLHTEVGLTLEQAVVLVNDNTLLKLFEDSLKGTKISAKLLANVLINDFTALLNKANLEWQDVSRSSSNISETVELLADGLINRNTARLLLNEVINGNDKKPIEIVNEKKWMQITDDDELKKLCVDVLNENSKIVKQYKEGKTKVYKAILGCVAVKSNQMADMAKCDIILRKLLKDK